MEQTIEGFKEILTGKYDHLPEVAFYMVGDISEVRKREFPREHFWIESLLSYIVKWLIFLLICITGCTKSRTISSRNLIKSFVSVIWSNIWPVIKTVYYEMIQLQNYMNYIDNQQSWRLEQIYSTICGLISILHLEKIATDFYVLFVDASCMLWLRQDRNLL